MDDGLETTEPSRKRLRTSHACDSCRARKIRCDGGHPCATCSKAEQACQYGSEANSRGKSDLILEGVLRVERYLYDLSAALAKHGGSSSTSSSHTVVLSPTNTAATAAAAAAAATLSSFSGSPHDETNSSLHRASLPLNSSPQLGRVPPGGSSFDNAVLDSMHTSTTESILQWPHFDAFPSLRAAGRFFPIFHLERSRPALPLSRSAGAACPAAGADEVDAVLEAFQGGVNFWYPTMSQRQVEGVRNAASLDGGVLWGEEDSVEACLALLTLALGCAGQAARGRHGSSRGDGEDAEGAGEVRWRLLRRRVGDMYFENALKKMHVAHLHVTSEAIQCLFFAAIYFASLVRPLQAWEFLSATASKCLLLLAYPPDDSSSEDQERIRRIFWSCYILESDYVAELSASPPSGIARIESSIPLPGTYPSHPSPSQTELSALYFLACISMRRLLNRVHQLLYARHAGAALDTSRFPAIVAELNHQLDDWRDVLPAAFSFSVDGEEVGTEAGGFLRQRYLTCLGVIHRPYLMWMLSGSRGGGGKGGGIDASAPSEDCLAKCKACIDACMLHVLNLRGFAHTVLVDAWICSLSMSGAMLILLAACQVPTLKSIINPQVLKMGDHLKQLFHEWRQFSFGADSPSVDQSLCIIHEADRFIKDEYKLEADALANDGYKLVSPS